MMVSSESADDLTRLAILALFAVELGVQQQIGHADDAVHRGADFVAHVGQEFALGAVGGFGRLFGYLQFLLRPFALGNIAKSPTRPTFSPRTVCGSEWRSKTRPSLRLDYVVGLRLGVCIRGPKPAGECLRVFKLRCDESEQRTGFAASRSALEWTTWLRIFDCARQCRRSESTTRIPSAVDSSAARMVSVRSMTRRFRAATQRVPKKMINTQTANKARIRLAVHHEGACSGRQHREASAARRETTWASRRPLAGPTNICPPARSKLQ